MIDYKRRYRELLEFTYGPSFYGLRWIQPAEAQVAGMMRQSLLEAIGSRAASLYKDNKLVYGGLSQGCKHCADGSWSCLFVNNRCNAKCFFCPSQQDETELPSTVMLYFKRPDSYAAYCEKVGIKGASISGGEPFITPKRSLAFIKACKKRLGSDFYFWLYTNGSLAKEELIKSMADAGLDEIRFDIAAWQYNLKMVKRAVGLVPTVTVETPAIPEDLPLMKQALAELADIGVQYVNIHQMRMTTYNCRNLMNRNYLLLEGPHPAVVESELAALELMLFAAENQLPLGINYCSFTYRNRFQRTAVQRQAARFSANDWEDITETGLIKRIKINGDTSSLQPLTEKLDSMKRPGQWCVTEDKGSPAIYLKLEPYESLLKATGKELPIELSYYKASLSDSWDAGSESVSITLDRYKTIYCLRKEIFSARLGGESITSFLNMLKGNRDTDILPDNGLNELQWEEIEFSELTEEGMQQY